MIRGIFFNDHYIHLRMCTVYIYIYIAECAQGSDIGEGGTGVTPAPVVPPTRHPAIEVYYPETLAPAAVEEEDVCKLQKANKKREEKKR